MSAWTKSYSSTSQLMMFVHVYGLILGTYITWYLTCGPTLEVPNTHLLPRSNTHSNYTFEFSNELYYSSMWSGEQSRQLVPSRNNRPWYFHNQPCHRKLIHILYIIPTLVMRSRGQGNIFMTVSPQYRRPWYIHSQPCYLLSFSSLPRHSSCSSVVRVFHIDNSENRIMYAILLTCVTMQLACPLTS